MTRKRSPSKSTCLVLAQLSTGPSYGYSLMKATGLKSGTLYPILMRLKERGFLDSHWQPAETEGRPPRQSYKLTVKGEAYAEETLHPPLKISTLNPVKT